MVQAEAEVVPSSRLVEVEVGVKVGVKVEVDVGVGVGAGLTFLVGWGGWLEIWREKLISTQVVVEVEVGVELGNKYILNFINVMATQDSFSYILYNE